MSLFGVVRIAPDGLINAKLSEIKFGTKDEIIGLFEPAQNVFVANAIRLDMSVFR